MRITFLTPVADMSGGARVVHIYATLLSQRGHDVSVVTRPVQGPSLKQRIKDAFRAHPKSEGQATPTHYKNTQYKLRAIDSARPIEARDLPDADVVIATWWETVEWMMHLPPAKGRKVHFVQHYEAFDNMPTDRVNRVYSQQITRITISAWLDELLKNRFKQNSVSLVLNSVDMSQFYAPPRGRRVRPTVGMLYSDIAWKDFRTGLKAFNLLRLHLPDARLVTFGNKQINDISDFSPDSMHTVLPAQDAIRDIYASCDVWVCSSTAEGFHLPPLEAMACRCPVISTPVGGPVDIVRDGVNGFLTPFSDPHAMAELLRYFFSMSDSAWGEMSQEAQNTASKYSWDDATDLFEKSLSFI